MTTPTLQFTLQSTFNEEEKHAFQFRPDAKKKSVFWLGGDHDATTIDSSNEASCSAKRMEININSPSQAIISLKASSSDNPLPWAVGGFQLVSNARQAHVYITAAPTNATSSQTEKEAFIMTVKGLPVSPESESSDDQKWYKALCAVPGGPRPAVSVRLVFDKLCNEDDSNPQFKLKWMKLTARVASTTDTGHHGQQPPSRGMQSSLSFVAGGPPTGVGTMGKQHHEHRIAMPQIPGLFGGTAGMNAGLAAASPATFASSPQQAEPLATASDVGAAMAGLHFSLRSTEERILKQIEASQDQFQKLLVQQQQNYLASLQRTIEQHQQWIEQKLENQRNELIDAFRRETGTNATPHSPSNTHAPYDTGHEYGKSTAKDEEGASNESLWLQYAKMDLNRNCFDPDGAKRS